MDRRFKAMIILLIIIAIFTIAGTTYDGLPTGSAFEQMAAGIWVDYKGFSDNALQTEVRLSANVVSRLQGNADQVAAIIAAGTPMQKDLPRLYGSLISAPVKVPDVVADRAVAYFRDSLGCLAKLPADGDAELLIVTRPVFKRGWLADWFYVKQQNEFYYNHNPYCKEKVSPCLFSLQAGTGKPGDCW